MIGKRYLLITPIVLGAIANEKSPPAILVIDVFPSIGDLL